MSDVPARSPYTLLLRRTRRSFAHRFGLIEGKLDDATIDTSLRDGVELKGARLWILTFAVFIASIGLNINSTAVIIGAMLISPLMGPIMGIGYGVGIYDFPLIKKSFINLGIVTGISFTTSTLYFLLTPLTQAQSELLARTTPTIWDVMVALFGGAAGIIGATRREKSNVIPGVAIATALMPPLCTAGYGLANWNFKFFFGAIYLFSINCVFIAVSTVTVVGFLGLARRLVDPHVKTRMKRILAAIVILTAAPSLYLAYRMVKAEFFKSAAQSFVSREFQFPQTQVAQTHIDPDTKRIEVTLIGEHVERPSLRLIERHLALSGLTGAVLVIHQAGATRIDVTSLKAGILSDLYTQGQKALAERDARIEALENDIANRAAWRKAAPDIARELAAQYPAFSNITIGEALEPSFTKGEPAKRVTILMAASAAPLTPEERQKITNWFHIRTKAEHVRLIVDAPEISTAKDRQGTGKR